MAEVESPLVRVFFGVFFDGLYGVFNAVDQESGLSCCGQASWPEGPTFAARKYLTMIVYPVIRFQEVTLVLKIIDLLMCIIFVASPTMAEMPPKQPVYAIKTLTIRWQRLVSQGETCPRCGDTEKEIGKALQTLEQSLNPLGIKVALEKQELNSGEFQKDPLQSNRIWIEGRSLEEWLGLKVGQTPCCQTCGDAECRTVETAGQVYETIPAELIVKAGLQAASNLVNPQTVDSCCPKDAAVKGSTPTCCPK